MPSPSGCLQDLQIFWAIGRRPWLRAINYWKNGLWLNGSGLGINIRAWTSSQPDWTGMPAPAVCLSHSEPQLLPLSNDSDDEGLSGTISPAAGPCLASDSWSCSHYPYIVFMLSESRPTPQVQKCTTWSCVPTEMGICLCFSNAAFGMCLEQTQDKRDRSARPWRAHSREVLQVAPSPRV